MSLVVIQAESEAPQTCPACNSYRIVAVYEPDLGLDPPYVCLCESCGWSSYEEPAAQPLAQPGASPAALARRPVGAD